MILTLFYFIIAVVVSKQTSSSSSAPTARWQVSGYERSTKQAPAKASAFPIPSPIQSSAVTTNSVSRI